MKTTAIMLLILFGFADFSLATTKAWGIWHRVRRGDTVWDISRKYKVSQNSILRTNGIRSARRLYPGKNLFVPGAALSASHEVKFGDTLSEIAENYGVTVKSLMQSNDLRSPHSLHANTEISIPNLHASGFRRPMRIPLVITSNYGYRLHPISGKQKFHHGIDFRAKRGTRVYASKSGRVIHAGWYGGYGFTVVLEHLGGYETWYGHLYVIRVKKGQRVKRREVIGLSGNSGRSTGPHLHFEIRWNEKSIDPYIRLNL